MSPAQPLLTGISALTLDAKGRMTLPARYREAMGEAIGAAMDARDPAGNTLALLESDHGCLLLMTHERWVSKVNELSEDDADDDRRRFWLGLSDTPEIDSAGRILLNPVLREGAGISREVMLLGVGPHFEIWDASRLAAHKEQVRARKLRGTV